MTSPHDLQYNPEPLAVSIPASGLLELRPFQIVSLLDMVEFEASEFFGVLNRLISVRKDLEKPDRPPLTPEEQVHMETHMNHADFMCGKYDIDVSYYTERVRNKIDQPERYTYSLASAVDGVKHCIFRELRSRKFMYMPSTDARYYSQAQLFGDDVKDRFPKANKEITLAGNCYATENYTACVFHLMRAVELGARRVIMKLKVQAHLNGIPVELCDWGTLVHAIEQGVRGLAAGTRTSLRKKETFEFYNHALGSFRNFKDAWRNNVSHTRKIYRAGETKDIMDNARQFMQHLATRLKE